MTALTYKEMNALTSSETADVFEAINNARHGGNQDELHELTLKLRKVLKNREGKVLPSENENKINVDYMSKLSTRY